MAATDLDDSDVDMLPREEGVQFDKENRLKAEFVRQVRDALEEDDGAQVYDLVEPLHPADIADLLELLDPRERRAMAAAITDLMSSEVIAELNDYVRDDMVEALILVVLSHVVEPGELLAVTHDYLGWIAPGLADTLTGEIRTFIGNWAVIGALGSVFFKRIEIGAVEMQAWAGLVSVAVLFPLSFTLETGQIAAVDAAPLAVAGCVLFAGVIVSVGAHSSYYWLLQRHDANLIVPFTLPVLALWLVGLELELSAFDLMLLGMGPDGHTASLFPGSAEVEEAERLAVPVHRPEMPQPWRVSMTLPVINASRQILMMVSGLAKAPMVRRAIAGDPGIPAGRLRPAGQLTWLLTEDAASELERPDHD